MIRRVVFALLVVGLAHPASGQDVPASKGLPTPQTSSKPGPSESPPPVPRPAEAVKDEAKKSISRLAPLPRRAAPVVAQANPAAPVDPLASVGRFANPGGVGRYAEYYTANTLTSQLERRPAVSARFGGAGSGRGGLIDRAGQIAAYQAGQSGARNLQNNINAYGRPSVIYGAGFGFGGFGGGGLRGGGLR